MSKQVPPPLSGNFAENAAIDPQTARELQIHEQVRKINDAKALASLDKICQRQKKDLDRVKTSLEGSREQAIKDRTLMILDEERNRIHPVLRPEQFVASDWDSMTEYARQQARAQTMKAERDELHAIRELLLKEQEKFLARTMSRCGRRDFNEKAREGLSTTFDGHSR